MIDRKMMRAIYLVRCNPALALVDFPERWRQHSALYATTTRRRPYFTDVSQCTRITVSGLKPPVSGPWDGVNFLGLVDREAAHEVWEEPDFIRVMLPDELETFSQPVRRSFFVCETEALGGGERGPYVALFVQARDSRRIASRSPERWWDVLQTAAVRAGINKVVEAPAGTDKIDLFVDCWFADEASLVAFVNSDAVQKIYADLGGTLSLFLGYNTFHRPAAA